MREGSRRDLATSCTRTQATSVHGLPAEGDAPGIFLADRQLPSVRRVDPLGELFDARADQTDDQAENRLHTIEAVLAATIGTPESLSLVPSRCAGDHGQEVLRMRPGPWSQDAAGVLQQRWRKGRGDPCPSRHPPSTRIELTVQAVSRPHGLGE